MSTEKCIPLHILEKITNKFSEHKKIGTGGYGDVYKADYNKRVVAVKLLHVDMAHGINDQLFINEVGNLLSVNHPNIVQLVGYSYETRSELVVHNAKRRLSKRIYRVLCFEYLQGGSLDKCVYGQSFAPNWSTRYNIIKGICEGLNFLHKCVPQILHLDLKPANILLDSFMKPKLADFGLSRIFPQLHSDVTKKIVGTWKYMPPEFRNGGIISSKNDVFSLGVVMLEIMTGRPTGYSNSSEMGDVAQLMKKVLTKWSTTIEATSKYQSEEIQQVKTCLELAIRCVAYERNIRPTIADILDTLNMTKTHIPKKQIPDVLPCPTIVPMSTECTPLKTVIAQLDNITMKHEHFSCMPKDSSSHNVQQALDRETTSDVAEESIIGRTKEKEIILSILFENVTEEMVILPIYGLGGIGKTTLAQLVYNDTQFQGYSQVWVYVSQKFDLNKIGNSIISQLRNKTSNIRDKQMLHTCLKDVFSGNKILIVLDDLWEENQKMLVELKAMLSLGMGRKVIMVTTRDGGIARKICSRAITPYKLEILTVDICWTIIKQKSNFEDRHDKKQLEHVGREIATKCGGLALAAQSLGYMLLDMKNGDEWESVRDSYIWNLSTLEGPSSGNNEVLESLLLSYSHMSYFLKLCFSYCAVFPKGHNIVKRDLIHQWIALGFIEPSAVFDSMQLCEKYITQLLGRSFLQYSKSTLSGKLEDKDVILFTMHDLVHDLATETLADKVNKKGDAVGSSCHYALLTDCSEPLQLSRSSPENTRFKFFFNLFQERSTPENIKALFFLDCDEIELSGDAFSPAKCLRVLDLSECFIYKLPNSIGGLKQLRYLHAPQIQYSIIPNCITELSELTYLNLRDCKNISAIPKSIGDLKGLRHLDLSGWALLRELPVSFAELKQLVHLDLSYCIISEVQALGSCTKLKYLNLSGCYGISELPKSFVELKQLVHLDLSNCRMPMSEDIGGLTKLQYLNLSHEAYHMNVYRGGLLEIIGNLIDLRYLNLSQCLHLMTRSNDQIGSLLDSISTLSNLEHLYLSGNQKLFSIPESIGNLRKLLTLDLSRCNQLKKLPHSMDQMVTLKVLYMERHMRLDQSTLSRLNAPSLPHFLVHASSDKCSSNISLLEHTNPKELTIDRLENVKSAAEAQSIQLILKQNIETLGFQWTAASERFVDDKDVLEQLVPPSSVQKLGIAGYRSVSIPDWVMGIMQYTPHLYSLSLFDFPNCKILPPLSQLPNLCSLHLYHMESLEEWNTAYTSGAEGANELMSSKLRRLTIEQCPKLRIEPCLPRAILNLEIIDCDNILSLLGKSSLHSGASSSSPITYLKVADSKVPLHQWRLLHHLPDLCNLTFTCCSNLKASRQIIQRLSSLEVLCLHQAELPRWLVKLTSLQELSLSKCRSMTPVPLWLGELISLRKLKIKDCEGIMALPDSIQELTELESVEIDGCPTLEKWCKLEENKMKLAHIIREKKWDPYEDWQNGTHPFRLRSGD